MAKAVLRNVIGGRIRGQREKMELTQTELAKKAKISVSFLSMIERGERAAHIDTMAAIAKALGGDLGGMFSRWERGY